MRTTFEGVAFFLVSGELGAARDSEEEEEEEEEEDEEDEEEACAWFVEEEEGGQSSSTGASAAAAAAERSAPAGKVAGRRAKWALVRTLVHVQCGGAAHTDMKKEYNPSGSDGTACQLPAAAADPTPLSRPLPGTTPPQLGLRASSASKARVVPQPIRLSPSAGPNACAARASGAHLWGGTSGR